MQIVTRNDPGTSVQDSGVTDEEILNRTSADARGVHEGVYCRSAFRFHWLPDIRSGIIGFCVSRTNN